MKSGINFKQFRKYLLKTFGEKCPDYEPGCVVCAVWRLYDDLKASIDGDDEQYEI